MGTRGAQEAAWLSLQCLQVGAKRGDSVAARGSRGAQHVGCAGVTGRTWREKRSTVAQDLYALAVALRVRCAGAGAARLSPVHVGAAPRAQPQGAYASRARQLQQHPACHDLATTKHRIGAHTRAVQLYYERLHLVEQHRARNAKKPRADLGLEPPIYGERCGRSCLNKPTRRAQ